MKNKMQTVHNCITQDKPGATFWGRVPWANMFLPIRQLCGKISKCFCLADNPKELK